MTATTSAAKRRANNKWDGENMTVLGCKVRKEIAEEFKAECKHRGTSPNEVFRAAISDFMTRSE